MRWEAHFLGGRMGEEAAGSDGWGGWVAAGHRQAMPELPGAKSKRLLTRPTTAGENAVAGRRPPEGEGCWAAGGRQDARPPILQQPSAMW